MSSYEISPLNNNNMYSLSYLSNLSSRDLDTIGGTEFDNRMGSIPGSAHPAFGFGAVTIVGGLAGYLRKGSKASLGAGFVCGTLLIGSGLMISGESQYGGHSLAAGTSALMALGMGQRFFKTGKFMPAGVVATLAAASLGYHVKKALEWKD
jgi:uncharacterized membrane protein (UPF0136 family)